MGDSPVAIRHTIHVHMPCIPRASCIMTLQVHRRIIAGSSVCFFQSAGGSLQRRYVGQQREFNNLEKNGKGARAIEGYRVWKILLH